MNTLTPTIVGPRPGAPTKHEFTFPRGWFRKPYTVVILWCGQETGWRYSVTIIPFRDLASGGALTLDAALLVCYQTIHEDL